MPYPYKTYRDWFFDEEKEGRAIRIKKPIKCGDYNNIVDIGNNIPGKIPETEVRALARYLHSLPEKPTALVESPIDNRPDIPVIVNPFPNRERVLRGIGVKNKDEFCAKLSKISSNRIRPVVVPKSQASCKQVTIPENEIDLRRDIPRIWVEFNQCLWTGCNGTWITYDPDSKSHGLAKTRWGQFEWENANPATPSPEDRVKRYGFCTVSRKYRPFQGNAGRFFYDYYRAQNKPMPCVFVYGIPPDMHLTAALKTIQWPEMGDEYEILGGLRGEPVRLVESETIPGLMVPADAEWIIEGEMLPEDYVTPPFGEDLAIGLMIGDAHWPMFRVKTITHRKDPWWIDATFSSSGSLNGHEGVHIGLAITATEIDGIMYLRNCGFKIKDVASIGGFGMTVVQTEVDAEGKPIEDYGQRIFNTLRYGLRQQTGQGATVVVGPDINPYDPHDVIWAMAFRGNFMGQIDALVKTPFIVQHVVAMTPKPGMLKSGATVRTDPTEWEIEAIERMRKKLAAK